MDNKKAEMHLAAEQKKVGWVTVESAPVHNPKLPTPTPMPVPMPIPEEEAPQPHRVLGMAYVPMQQFRDVYEAEEGFPRGTIFAELDYPFMGKGDCHERA